MIKPPSRNLKKIRKEGIAPPHFHQKLDRSQAAAPTSTFEVVNLFLSTEHGNMEMVCSMQAKCGGEEKSKKKGAGGLAVCALSAVSVLQPDAGSIPDRVEFTKNHACLQLGNSCQNHPTLRRQDTPQAQTLG